jgi:hypothetical protein
MDIIKMPKNAEKYVCNICIFKCCKQSNYIKHINTPKHKNNEKGYKMIQNNATANIEDYTKNYTCECGNVYKHYSGLWRHKKNCQKEPIENTEEDIENFITPEMIMNVIQQNQDFKNLLIEQNKQNQELQKQNNELQKQMLEVIKNGTNNTNINNSNNKTFNLQFFLNETCKDAMNISEFVSSIKVQLEDLETTGRLGYVEGVSRIINKNLNDLDQSKRPIHCSDVKREVLYIKNDDQWIKENENKPILTKAIKQIANENIKQIGEWRKKYPDCTDSDSRKNDLYLNIVSNAMSGTTAEEQSTNYEKIITKVAKEVVIEK